jgi:hypothetical protein
MKEVALMHPSKETDNKLRWQSMVEGVSFKLYIPKWRVPRPWPVRIIVSVTNIPKDEGSAGGHRSPDSHERVTSLEQPIIATLRKVREHTQTVRFAPQGDPDSWEIGEPYIPHSLLPDTSSDAIQIEVRWDRSAGTWSDE